MVIDVKDRLTAQEDVLERNAEGITELADSDVLRDHVNRFNDLWLSEPGMDPIPEALRDSVGDETDLDG